MDDALPSGSAEAGADQGAVRATPRVAQATPGYNSHIDCTDKYKDRNVSKFAGGRRGIRFQAAVVAFCVAGVTGQGVAGGWRLPAPALTLRQLPQAVAVSVPRHPLLGLVPPAEDGTDTVADDPTPEDTPSLPTDPGTPTDTPSTDPASTPPDDPASTAPPPPPPPPRIVKVDVGVSVADLTEGYWNGDNSTSFTIYLTNTGTIAANVHVTYTLPAGVTDRGSTDCNHGVCDTTLAAGLSGRVLLKVNVAVSPQAWRKAPLGGSVSVHAQSVDTPAVVDDEPDTNWGLNFPPGPPVNGLTLTAEDVPLGARFSTAGQLVAHFTNTGKVAGVGELQVVTPPGVSVTSFPAECASHHPAGPDTESCQLGSVPAGATKRVVFGLSISPKARADAPVVGVLRAALAPAGLDPLATQASWQIKAAPQSPGAVAEQGVLPSPAPSANASGDPTDGDAGGPIDQFTGYAAAVQGVGWQIAAASWVVINLVLLGLLLGLRRRRIRPVPLFPAPLPAGPRPDRTPPPGGRASRPVSGNGSTPGSGRGSATGSDGGVGVHAEPDSSDAIPGPRMPAIQHVDGGPLPQRAPATPPDRGLATRTPAESETTSGSAAPGGHAVTAPPETESERTTRLPVVGAPVQPAPFAGNGYAPGGPVEVRYSADGEDGVPGRQVAGS